MTIKGLLNYNILQYCILKYVKSYAFKVYAHTTSPLDIENIAKNKGSKKNKEYEK